MQHQSICLPALIVMAFKHMEEEVWRQSLPGGADTQMHSLRGVSAQPYKGDLEHKRRNCRTSERFLIES